MSTRTAEQINQIIVHCSDSEFGSAEIIDAWHRERGWDGIGYHFVICNGVKRSGVSYETEWDGRLQRGRSELTVGAHCKGHNAHSIGICLIGVRKFTGRQILLLDTVLGDLCRKYNISADSVLGHCELNPDKTCPNLPMPWVRSLVRNNLGRVAA